MSAEDAPLDCYGIVAPGVERLLANEITALGIAVDGREVGGVAFRADARGLWRANLESRIASRFIVRLATFRARAFGELARRAAALPWERFLAPGNKLRLRVTSKKSRLFHTDAIAERLFAAAGSRLGRPVEQADVHGAEDDEPEGEQLAIVRLTHDECTVSFDSSGPLLHRRGYRLATARAPMRETLAAAMLHAVGWRADEPLVDPLCGAGTIPIEAAMLGRRIPPGAGRDFAFMRWPGFDANAWRVCRDAVLARALERAPSPIVAADRDAGAIDAARTNAERAGVANDISLRVAALSSAEPPSGDRGWLITNPPYGVRLGDQRALRDLYARLGQLARSRFPGWRIAIVSNAPSLAAQTGLRWHEALRTRTGGLAIRVLWADV